MAHPMLPCRPRDLRWRWPLGSVVLGRTNGGKGIWVPPELRTIHMHLIGASNQGKSKLLEGLIRQDILELDGVPRSIILFDPHGTLFADLLTWYTTHGLHRVRPIRILDPADRSYVFGLNPVRRREDVDPAVIAGAVMNAMAKVWGGEDPRETPQLRESLKAILYTLVALNLTLLDADELMSIADDNALRNLAIEKVGHPSIKRFWLTIQALRPRERDEKLGSAVRRLNEFLLPQAIRNIIGQRDQVIDFREVMDAGEVVLMNLAFDSGRLSEDEATLLGTLILNDLFLSCLGRRKGSLPCFVYIDECQRYLTQDVANILDQARKFGLHLILAHQHLGHLREAGEHIYRSVMTNARTKVVFGGLDDEDATLMARNLFRGTYDLQRPKHRYDKPVVIDQVPDWLRSESNTAGSAHAVGRSTSYGRSKGTNHSTTRSHSTTWSESETLSESTTISESDTASAGHTDSWSDTQTGSTSDSWTDTRASGSAWNESNTDGANWSEGSNSSATSSRGQSAGDSYQVDSSQGLFGPYRTGEHPVGRSEGADCGQAQSSGMSASRGGSSASTNGTSTSTSFANATGGSQTYGTAHTQGGADTYGTAHTTGVAFTSGYAHTTGIAETEGTAETTGTTSSRNWSRGSSSTDTTSQQHTTGRSQGLRSVLQVMPTQAYSLEDLVHIASVRIANLDVGEAIVKIGKRAPVRIRTLRIRDGWARSEHVARVKQRLYEATPYIMRTDEAKALQAEQRKAIEMELRPKLTFDKRKRAPVTPPGLKDEEWG